MAYATYEDVQARMVRTLDSDEQAVCTTLLADAAILIDTYYEDASTSAKLLVSCRMVIRALGDGASSVPIGATQGSMSALNYSQSWTLGAGSASGELYLSKSDKQILRGYSDTIGSYSPLEELVSTDDED